MKKLNKKGFTIVELVIVIAVIGILAGVLIPTFTIVVRKANESAAMQALDTARKEYMTVVDAAADDFSKFDATYYYYIPTEKKGQNYKNLQGVWKFENGAWDRVADNTSAYTVVYEYEKANAFVDDTAYYNADGTSAGEVTASTFGDAVRYTRKTANYSGVEIYTLTVAP